MRILVITACTGKKAISHDKAPVLADFQQGAEYLDHLHEELVDFFLPSEKLYTGQQHVLLMSAVEKLRIARRQDGTKPEIDLFVLSAGYGLIKGSYKLPPYEVTFSGMKKKELREWADHLNIPNDFRNVVKQPYDLAFILLGDNYLDACDLNESIELGGPTIMFCGKAKAEKLPEIEKLKKIGLGNPEAKQFSCALIGLKGDLAGRVLKAIEHDESIQQKLLDADLPLELINTLKVSK